MTCRKIVLLSIILFSALLHAVPEGIPIQYIDPRGRIPMTTAQRHSARADRGPYARTVTCLAAGSDADKVVLLVDASVESGISASLDTYVNDLESEGYIVDTWVISGGTAQDIRTDLQAEYSGGDLVGAVCIGDIPTGWLDNGNGEYPVDVYLMDMNGTWNDTDSDGVFESYSSGGPEIWVGRLTPDYLTFGGSAELLNQYFAKNHAYRTGALFLPDRALAYEEAFPGLTGYLNDLYSTVVLKNDAIGTNADDFKAELLTGYEWVHLISHSSPWGSSFHTGAPPEGAGTLNNLEVPPLDPHAFFYVLNCCSNGRWTEVDNLANSYIWCDSYGLAALAQAKVDYTNDFQEYYQALASGDCLGEAFRDWLGSNMYNEDGAVLLGDPTLRPRLNTVNRFSLQENSSPSEADSWLKYDLTDGLHTQGRVDTYYDPYSEQLFAVCGTSDPVRANILSTYTDGDSWAAPIQVSDHTYWDWHPTVGGDGTGNVWTAWQSMENNHEGYDIYISTWSGSDWIDETILTSGDPFEIQPAMDGGSGHAWLVWQKYQNASTDIEGVFWTGSQWTNIQTISDEDGAERYPDVAFSDSGFGLTYHAKRDGYWVVCFRDAPDSGPFEDETVISETGTSGRFADITACGSEYWVAWQDDSGSIKCSHGSGSSWSTPVTVSSASGNCRPAISASSAGEVNVMWTWNNTQLHTNTYTGGSWQGYTNAISEDAVDDASLCWTDDKLWAVYGRRESDLQWDLWACTPDPTGIAGSFEGPQPMDISVSGRNPFSGSVQMEITVRGTGVLNIYDMSGRSIVQSPVESGSFIWDGGSAAGAEAPSGVYFAVLSGEAGMKSCRLVKI